MIENDVIEAIIVLPNRMFYTTDISVTCWILNKNKNQRFEKRDNKAISYRNRSKEVLFMDLRQMGHPYEKKFVEFNKEDIETITNCFNSWREEDFILSYKNMDGFCYSAKRKEIVDNDYSLIPSKYIKFTSTDNNVDYNKQMKELTSELSSLLKEEKKSRDELREVLEELGYDL